MWSATQALRSSIGQSKTSSTTRRSGTSKSRMKMFKSSIHPRR